MAQSLDRAQPDRPGNAKRAAILDAATAAFRDEGYDTSMDRIAELAGVSKRTVYDHFGSKEALFRSVVDQLVERAKSLKCVRWDPSRTLEEQLHDFVRAKIAVVEDPAWSGLVRVIAGVFIHHPELATESPLRPADGDDPLVHWLEAATIARQMNVCAPILAANVFWAMVTGALFWPALFGAPLSAAKKQAITSELIATFLARYRT